MSFDETNWLAYREANLLFAEAVCQQVKAGDLVWVQDYHLCLLPMMLRGLIEGKEEMGAGTRKEMRKIMEGLIGTEERRRMQENGGQTVDGQRGRGKVKIGFFLHTPFPSSEMFR
jgi:trehalose 6-phosphate synthase